MLYSAAEIEVGAFVLGTHPCPLGQAHFEYWRKAEGKKGKFYLQVDAQRFRISTLLSAFLGLSKARRIGSCVGHMFPDGRRRRRRR